jgi:cytochrome b561
MALHWLLALVILGLFAVGLYMADLPFSPLRLKLYNWHKWAGITLLALTVLRLLWRLTHRPPALPPVIEQAMPSWQLRAYHATHHLMYALFFAVPLIGWAYSSAAGFPIVLFGQLPLPDFVAPSKELAALIKPLHELSAFGLIGLAGMHIAAALKHHWIDRDGLLNRMLPGRS